MNIQPGKVNAMRRNSSNAGNSAPFRQLGNVLRWMLLVAAFAAVLEAHIYLNQCVNDVEKRLRTTRRDIANTRNELINLRNRIEERSRWEYIRERMAYYRLNLRPAKPGQVHSARVIDSATARRLATHYDRQNRIAQSRTVKPKQGRR